MLLYLFGDLLAIYEAMYLATISMLQSGRSIPREVAEERRTSSHLDLFNSNRYCYKLEQHVIKTIIFVPLVIM